MRKSLMILAAMGILLPALALAQRKAGSGPPPTPVPVTNIDHCFIALSDHEAESKVPAQEAGVLVKVNVREGQEVEAGTILGQIDDVQSQAQRRMVAAELRAAQDKASSEIDIEHATAAAEVARFGYAASKLANDRVASAFSDVDMKEKKFQWDKMVLAIAQARRQKILDGFTADAKKAELDAADEGINRRQMKAPISGVVQKIFPHHGEWLKPGDPVFRIIRMDRLSVEGSLNKDLYKPSDVNQRPVIVQVTLPGEGTLQFKGKIVFADLEVQGDGMYQVRAEVVNQKDKNGQWLLRPGLPATMTIQMN